MACIAGVEPSMDHIINKGYLNTLSASQLSARSLSNRTHVRRWNMPSC